MGFGRGAAILIVASLAFAGAARAEDCQLSQIGSFPISLKQDGAVAVPVTLNGQKESFLVDTGGVITDISPSVAEALKLTPIHVADNFEVYAADGTLLNHYVIVDEMDIGVIHASYAHLLIDRSSNATGTYRYQGTLGPDYLRNFDLDFDFGGNTLNLISPKHCKGQVVYWASAYADVPFALYDGYHIEVPVTLDGHDFQAIVDTGSWSTLLSAGAASHVFGLGPGSPGVEAVAGAADSLVPYRYQFKSLVIGGITVKNPRIGLEIDAASKKFWQRHGDDKLAHDPVHGFDFKPQPIILGLDVLSKLHLYIAYGEKTLYVTPAAAGHAAAAHASAAANGGH